jgi:hypothetical protein
LLRIDVAWQVHVAEVAAEQRARPAFRGAREWIARWVLDGSRPGLDGQAQPRQQHVHNLIQHVEQGAAEAPEEELTMC